MVLWRPRKTVVVVDHPALAEPGGVSAPSPEAPGPPDPSTTHPLHASGSPYAKSADPIAAVRKANLPESGPPERRDKNPLAWGIKRPQNVKLMIRSTRPAHVRFTGKAAESRQPEISRNQTRSDTRTDDTIDVPDRCLEDEDPPKNSGRLGLQEGNSVRDGAIPNQDDLTRKKEGNPRYSTLPRESKTSQRITPSPTGDHERGVTPKARARRGSVAFPLSHPGPWGSRPDTRPVRPRSSCSAYGSVRTKRSEGGASPAAQAESRQGRPGSCTVRARRTLAWSPPSSSAPPRSPPPHQPSFASKYIAEIFQTSDRFLISRSPEAGKLRPASARPPPRPRSAQSQTSATSSTAFRSKRIRPASALPISVSSRSRETVRCRATGRTVDTSRTPEPEEESINQLQRSPRTNCWRPSGESVTQARPESGDDTSPKKIPGHSSPDIRFKAQENGTTSNDPVEDSSRHPLHPSLEGRNSNPLEEAYLSHQGDRSDHQSDSDLSCSPLDSYESIRPSTIAREAIGIASDSDLVSESESEPESSYNQSQSVNSSRLQLASGTSIGQQSDEEVLDNDGGKISIEGSQTSQDTARSLDTRVTLDTAQHDACPHSDPGTRPTSAARQPPFHGSATRKHLETHFQEEKRAVLDDLRSDLCRRLRLRKRSGIMSDAVFQKQVRSSFWTADMLYHRWGNDLLDMRNKWTACTGRLSDQSEIGDEVDPAFPRGRRFAFSNQRTAKDSTLDIEALRSHMGTETIDTVPDTAIPDDPTSGPEAGSGRGHPELRRTATDGSLPPASRRGSRVEGRPQAAFQNLADLNAGPQKQAEEPEARRARLRALFISTITKVMRIARVAMCMTKSSKAMNVANWMAQIQFYNTRTMEEELTFEKEKFSRKYSKLNVPNWVREVGLKPPWERSPDDVMALYSILKNLKSFEKFTHQMRMEICRAAAYSCCEKGRVILRQGHVGHNFYFIFSGSVFVQIDIEDAQTGVMTHSKTIVMEKGSSFGELALLGGGTGKRRASIICRETTELFEIAKETFLELCPDIFERELQEKIAAAMNVEIFHQFPADALERLCFESYIEEVTYDRVIERDTANTDTIFFILEGKVTMLKEFDLSRAHHGTSIQAYEQHDLPTPRPGQNSTNRGRQTLPHATDRNSCFMKVGELRKGDCTEIALLHASADRTSPSVILLSNGARIMQMPKRKVEQFAPRHVLDQLRKQPVQALSIPSSEDLYRKYLGDVNWADFKSKVVDTLHEEKEGALIVSKPSTAKGSTGWARWPGLAGVTGSSSSTEWTNRDIT